jgi:hypothetical protein
MIIVNLTGGLGNQLFQYSFARYLARINNCDLKLDVSSYENYEWHNYSLSPFNIDEIFATPEECDYYKGTGLTIINKIYRKLFKLNYFLVEDSFQFNPKYKLWSSPVYISGYWQSEKYFKELESELRNQFRILIPASKKNQEFIDQMQLENSVSLHIRRGNYVDVSHVNEVHGTCSMNYYKSAVAIIASKVTNPKFYVFSDDIEWAKDNLVLNFETIFVDINDSKTDYEDLRLMSTCKHNITANSTFSWWGAWLNSSKNKIVVSPKIWFKDEDLNTLTSSLIPEEWYRI